MKESPGRGIVYLVGAGPGAPDLLTLRGAACLERAEVVIYDRLVHPDLLERAPAAALRIYAGKAPGRPHLEQAEINRLLIDFALAGEVVVRLKGGDPFVFGRGGEEALACAAAGVACEVVPGLSAAGAVPASAGIPLTHRGLAASFAVVTAHRAADLDELDWPALARMDTLVVLMGVARLRFVTANLVRNGRPRSTPAALVERGTLPGERRLVATLGTLAERADEAGVAPPATIVVGEVVSLGEAVLGHEVLGSSAPDDLRYTAAAPQVPDLRHDQPLLPYPAATP